MSAVLSWSAPLSLLSTDGQTHIYFIFSTQFPFIYNQTFQHISVILSIVFKNVFLLVQTQPEEGEGEEEVVDLFTTPTTKMAAAISDFGYNLFRQLSSHHPTANVFMSPISVSLALTQLAVGKETMDMKL